MENVKCERIVSRNLLASVGINGVREGDEFILDVFQEKKQTLKLNRTRYKFKFSKSFEIDYLSAEIHLPVFEENNAEFELLLIQSFNSYEHNKRSRYLFKSLKNYPFKLNGSYCFEAFLERGDIIDLGFNRICFSKKNPQLNLLTNEFVIPIDLIKSPMNILLEGETGTGKTTIAKKIHDESGRSGKFVHLNLAAFSRSLVESEIFGHVKGAFTGAINSKKGAILEASKGTLFLDEIDSLSVELQTKLLLFLDDHKVRQVGSDNDYHVDVRLILASGSSLQDLVDEGKMRKDFYFRINSGGKFNLQPLRFNHEQITLICRKFEKDNFVNMNEDLIKFYLTCHWPGNIRQLVGHLQKKKYLSNGKKLELEQMDFDLKIQKTHLAIINENAITPLEEIKRDYCFQIYLRSGKNAKQAAKLLGISQNTLRTILEKNYQDAIK